MAIDKKCVLVIEDDLFLRDILTQKLLKSGFDIEGAIDAGEAFQILEKKHVDLILLDLLLPGIGGQEILHKIKQDEKLAHIPVIVASNLDNPEEKQRVMSMGAVDYMIKAQHTPDEIITRVRDILEQQMIAPKAAA